MTVRRFAPTDAGPCIWPTKRDPITGLCKVFAGVQPGPDPQPREAAAIGSRGAYAPMVEMRQHRECFPGDVLGRDGLCHSKADISNKNRAHPRGRRPLGTPGEMAALAKAASFGRRMETTVKRMQKIGVLKKPGRRAATRPRQPQRLIGPGSVTVIDTE